MTTIRHRWAMPEIISRDEKDQRSKEPKVEKPNVLPDKVLTSEPILKPPEAVLKPEVTTEIKSIDERHLKGRALDKAREKMSPEERFYDSLRRWRQSRLKRELRK